MTSETRFLCQTYRRQQRGKTAEPVLVKAVAVECKTAAEAEARAHKMFAGRSHAGVDAYSVEIDVDLGDYSDPHFLVRLGDVPPLET